MSMLTQSVCSHVICPVEFIVDTSQFVAMALSKGKSGDLFEKEKKIPWK